MADEQTKTEDTAAAEATGGGEETAVVEETAAAEETSVAEGAAAAEDTADAENAADAEETPPAEEPAGAEEPTAEEPAAPEAVAEAAEPAAAEETAAAAPSEHTYDELKGMTVARMREIAEGVADHDALHGYTTMHKEELLLALCTALGIEAHEHHEVVGIDKAAVKAKIRSLKQQREALIEAKDSKQLKLVRSRIRRLKRKIHKATV